MASTRFGDNGVAIERLDVSAYTVPTDFPESDGTITWNKTTMVLVEATAGGKRSVGYSYADTATARLINELLKDIVVGQDAMAVPGIWKQMVHAIRNLGRPGICSMAIAAVDASLWDLKARLLDLPLVTLLGQVRESAPIYGSGGFTSYSREQLQRQLGEWVADGIPHVKMKIGRHPDADPLRVANAREAIGPDTELFVDANGAYSRALFDATERFEAYRPPEVFAGLQRKGDMDFPVLYPGGANIPQAWATGSIFHMVRTMLGLRADAPHKRLYVHPTLPDWLPDLELQRLRVGPCALTIRFWREGRQSRWEVREVARDQGVKEEDTIQVMDDPDAAQHESH